MWKKMPQPHVPHINLQPNTPSYLTNSHLFNNRHHEYLCSNVPIVNHHASSSLLNTHANQLTPGRKSASPSFFHSSHFNSNSNGFYNTVHDHHHSLYQQHASNFYGSSSSYSNNNNNNNQFHYNQLQSHNHHHNQQHLMASQESSLKIPTTPTRSKSLSPSLRGVLQPARLRHKQKNNETRETNDETTTTTTNSSSSQCSSNSHAIMNPSSTNSSNHFQTTSKKTTASANNHHFEPINNKSHQTINKPSGKLLNGTTSSQSKEEITNANLRNRMNPLNTDNDNSKVKLNETTFSNETKFQVVNKKQPSAEIRKPIPISAMDKKVKDVKSKENEENKPLEKETTTTAVGEISSHDNIPSTFKFVRANFSCSK
jgi:hypothetical protein